MMMAFGKWPKQKWRRRGLKILLAGLGLFFIFLLLDLLFPLPKPKAWSPTVFSSDSTMLCAYLSEDDKWRLRTQPQDVTPELLKALIRKEDRWFYYHPGINPLSVLRALTINITTGRRTSGASTITMQVARLNEPAPRTYLYKIREMFRALQYEWHFSKEEILSLYLSYLPYGSNIEGVSAASWIYFDRPPGRLSLAQSVLLAIIPNRPNSLRPDQQKKEAMAARNQWLKRFSEQSVFPEALIEEASIEPLKAKRHELPPQTPHFCLEQRRRYPDQDRLYTTLDRQVQETTQRLLTNHVRRLKPLEISNGSVLVVENQTASVRAWCGSADFGDEAAQGQVDGITAIRSPGSTLKPLVYGMGFDLGYITPASHLLDVPTIYEGFTPENYDDEFHGSVSVREALGYSLNIPPVRLAQEIGLKRILDQLERTGFRTIARQREGLGLSVVLGGCGVTLEELTRFYAALANRGRLKTLRIQSEVETDSGLVVLSPEASWMLADILSQLERPDLPRRHLESSTLPKVAWKTGTSFGRRDAWAIGFTPRYTIGVWMGNFDGHGVSGLSGSATAVPLLLDLFTALEKNNQDWFERPYRLLRRPVCVETGLLPSENCRKEVLDDFIEHVSPLLTCNLDQEIYINLDSTVQYCPACLPKSDFQRAVYPIYDAQLALWMESQSEDIRRPPPHFEDCEASFSGGGPRIISPSSDYRYLIERGSEQEILLQAASDPTISKHHWYVNGRFLATTPAGEKYFWRPVPGKVEIVCMDEKGRKTRIEVSLKFY